MTISWPALLVALCGVFVTHGRPERPAMDFRGRPAGTLLLPAWTRPLTCWDLEKASGGPADCWDLEKASDGPAHCSAEQRCLHNRSASQKDCYTTDWQTEGPLHYRLTARGLPRGSQPEWTTDAQGSPVSLSLTRGRRSTAMTLLSCYTQFVVEWVINIKLLIGI